MVAKREVINVEGNMSCVPKNIYTWLTCMDDLPSLDTASAAND